MHSKLYVHHRQVHLHCPWFEVPNLSRLFLITSLCYLVFPFTMGRCSLKSIFCSYLSRFLWFSRTDTITLLVCNLMNVAVWSLSKIWMAALILLQQFLPNALQRYMCFSHFKCQWRPILAEKRPIVIVVFNALHYTALLLLGHFLCILNCVENLLKAN